MKRSRLERILSVFTDVRPREGATALLMFANVFLILCAYYFIKPLREGWLAIENIPGLSKMEVKAYSSFMQTLLLVPVVALYGRLSGRWDRSPLITRSTLFCMTNLLIFYFLQPGLYFPHIAGSGIIFFLWVGMFSVFVVAQFWTFTADLYTDERGRRLLPLIAIGANAGAATGSLIVGSLLDLGLFDREHLLLLANIPLAASIWLTRLSDKRGPLGRGAVGEPLDDEEEEEEEERSGRGSIGLVLTNRFLLVTAAMTLVMFWVITNGENLLFRVVQDFLARDAAATGITGEGEILEFTQQGTTIFYGDFYFWVNTAALVLQSLVASRMLKYGGFALILLMLPVVSMISYATAALLPVLAVFKVMKIAENSTNYSINNTARHVLWLPTTSEMKFKGKPTIDTLVVRAGDGLAAVTAFLGVQVWALATQAFFVVNVALVFVWVGLALVVIRMHRRLARRKSRGDKG